MPARIGRRLSSERALGITVSFFIVLIAISISGVTLALLKGYRTQDQVRAIARHQAHILRPTAAEERAAIDQAIRSLSPDQVKALLLKLSPAQVRQIQRERQRRHKPR